MKELDIQNQIRVAATMRGNIVTWRNNVGTAWQGEVVTMKDGSKLIRNPRLVHFGLCEGSSDLIGITTVTVTPEMVGKRVGIFTAIEVKQPGKNPTPTQRQFIAEVRERGGRAGVATGVAGAMQIIGGVL
jgi:hypothetical protein